MSGEYEFKPKEKDTTSKFFTYTSGIEVFGVVALPIDSFISKFEILPSTHLLYDRNGEVLSVYNSRSLEVHILFMDDLDRQYKVVIPTSFTSLDEFLGENNRDLDSLIKKIITEDEKCVESYLEINEEAGIIYKCNRYKTTR